MTQSNILLISELPNEHLKAKATRICKQEKRDPSGITFEPTDDPNYMEMLELNEKTYWGYFIKQNDID